MLNAFLVAAEGWEPRGRGGGVSLFGAAAQQRHKPPLTGPIFSLAFFFWGERGAKENKGLVDLVAGTW